MPTVESASALLAAKPLPGITIMIRRGDRLADRAPPVFFLVQPDPDDAKETQPAALGSLAQHPSLHRVRAC